MFTGRKKIVKAKGAEPDEFEQSVAQELFNLEMSQAEIKSDLQNLHIVAAKQVEIQGGKKAIIIFVPYKLLTQYHKIQSRLVRELEKKFRCVRIGERRLPRAEGTWAKEGIGARGARGGWGGGDLGSKDEAWLFGVLGV
jgi:small subunit ribosomal protein S7e